MITGSWGSEQIVMVMCPWLSMRVSCGGTYQLEGHIPAVSKNPQTLAIVGVSDTVGCDKETCLVSVRVL